MTRSGTPVRSRARALRSSARLLSWSAALVCVHGTAHAGGASLRAAPEPARAFACARGLPSAVLARPRPRVLVEGRDAADVVLACADAAGMRTIDVAAVTDPASEPGRAPTRGAARVVFHPDSARALARRSQAGRYDLIVLAPEVARASPWSPLPGAPALLSETREGLTELLIAVRPDGALLALLPGEPLALRFALTALRVLRDGGLELPASRLVIASAHGLYAVWISPGPIALETLLELHARDRERRKASPVAASAGAPPWAARLPTLLHTPGAVLDNRVARIVLGQGGRDPEPLPEYRFDIAPVTDDRPLFTELTRREQPRGWPDGSWYARSLVALLLVFAALLFVAVLGARALRRDGAKAARLLGGAACAGAGAILVWAWLQQALARLLADARLGASVATLGVVLGAAAALFGPLRLHRSRAWTFAACALAVALGLAAVACSQLVALGERQPAGRLAWLGFGLSGVAGVLAAVPARAVLGAARTAGRAALRASAALLGVAAVWAVTCVPVLVLFADARAVGAAAAAALVLAQLVPPSSR